MGGISTPGHRRSSRLLALAAVAVATIGAAVAFGAKSSFEFDRASIPVGGSPIDVATADFDGDGRLDLAVTDFASGMGEQRAVTILEGLKNGKFQPQPEIPLTDTQPDGIVAARVDKGKDWDLVFSAPFGLTEGVAVLLGGPGVAFSAPTVYPVETSPRYVATADFNRDKRTDVVTSDADTGGISVLLGAGAGELDPPVSYPGAGPSAGRIVTGKFNGGKSPDVAVPDPDHNSVDFYFARKNGTFKPFKPVKVGISPQVLTLGDVNGDGRKDIAAAGLRKGSSELRGAARRGGDPDQPAKGAVLLGKRKGGFGPARTFKIGPVGYIGDVELGRFDDGGKLDLATSLPVSGGIALLPGNGYGGFGKAVKVPSGPQPVGMTSGGFDKGRTADLAVVNEASDEISVLLGR